MAIRTLKRKVIIREYDFNKVKHEATGLHYDGVALYDRVSFMPLDQVALEKLKVLDILKGKNSTPMLETKWGIDNPTMLLYDLRDYLYNDQYYNWNPSVDEDGFICVQARKNTPKTRLGWGVFEKDLQCRL